ncbi:hypothetical protein D1007_03904 [Hordeum vulgare]|nr:hypothetical protein D1007_03904 [Hordeum vulgare]
MRSVSEYIPSSLRLHLRRAGPLVRFDRSTLLSPSISSQSLASGVSHQRTAAPQGVLAMGMGVGNPAGGLDGLHGCDGAGIQQRPTPRRAAASAPRGDSPKGVLERGLRGGIGLRHRAEANNSNRVEGEALVEVNSTGDGGGRCYRRWGR